MTGGSAVTVSWADLLAATVSPDDLPGPDSEEARLGGSWEADDP